MGRDRSATISFPDAENFNPRARVGRDHAHLIYAVRAVDFNPRARVGRDYASCCAVSDVAPFQSTRPHGGATGDSLADAIAMGISIHAPAWGRDICVMYVQYIDGISIHAPAWGRDEVFAVDDAEPGTFQSTRPHGGATLLVAARKPDAVISIHAPSWGATGLKPQEQAKVLFQSTRPRGARHKV